MKVAPMGEVKNNFGKYLAMAVDEPISLRRTARSRRVIEHIEDSEIEDFLLERNARFRRMLGRVKREKDGMSLDEYRKSRRV